MDFKRYKLLKKNIFQFDATQNTFLKRYDEVDSRYLNPLIQAYVGDAYFHLYVRTNLLSFEQNNVRILNDISMLFVSATWQAKAFELVKEHLNDEELAIFKRAKNTKSHAPRVASVKDYHTSTGIEAVMGYLYLNHDLERLDYLCQLSLETMMKIYYQANQ